MGIYKTRIDLTGLKFNRCTVLKAIDGTNPLKWEFVCDCGKIKTANACHLKSGRVSSCGCKRKENGKDKWKGHEEISGEYFSRIRTGAKKRKLEFNITIEYIWNLFLQQSRRCIFSGVDIHFSPSREDKRLCLATASLDRIDSKKGYVEGNVQWVHKDINFMKQELSDEYFIEMCKNVYETRCVK